MSKTNSLKKKTTGFDIFYRVATSIMVVAMFPLAYFSNLLFVVVMHEEVSSLLELLGQPEDPGGTYFEWSTAELLDMLMNSNGENLSLSAIWGNQYLRAVLFAVIFFAIALIIALVILGFALFSNKIKVITWLSGAGFLSTIASFISFDSFFAKPIVNDIVPLGEVLNLESGLTNIALSFMDVTMIKLEGAFFFVMFLMLGILILSASVLIVNNSDEKEKAIQKK